MFLDESAFEDTGDFRRNTNSKAVNSFDLNTAGRYGNSSGSRPNTAGSKPPLGMAVHDLEEDDDEDGGIPAFGSAGGLATPSSSRARMLAQQRELQLKKRQTAMSSGGMVRSSDPIAVSSPGPAKSQSDSQFTPAVRQFSAPKALRDSSADAPAGEQSSEFSRPPRGKTTGRAAAAATSRFSDDEADAVPGSRRQSDAVNRNGMGSGSATARPANSRRFVDDEDDQDTRDGYRRNRDKGKDADRDKDKDDLREGSRDRDRDRDRDADRDRDRGIARRERAAGRSRFDEDDDADDYPRKDGKDLRDRDRDSRDNRDNRGARNDRDRTRDDRDSRDRGDRDSRDRDSYNRAGRETRDNYGSRDRDRDRDRDYDKDRDRDRDRGRDNYDDYDRRSGDRARDRDSYDGDRDRDRDRERDRGDRGGGRGGSGGRDGDRGSTDRDRDRWEAASGARNGGDADYDRDRDRDRGEKDRDRDRDSGAPAARSLVVPPTPLNLSDMRAFLATPVPKSAGVVQCYIRRNKNGTNKLFPVYMLYLKEGDRFLMASKKRPNNKTSNYLISMGESDLSRDGANYLGKLRSNFVGTEFQIFDNGTNPKDKDPDEASWATGVHVRRELGAVMYAANVLGSRGPRKMQVALPAVDESDRVINWPSGGSENEIMTRMKDRNFRDLVYLINKPPRWNEQVGAYVLNFNGRVTMASVKNFQLVDPDEQNAVVLQFGRVGKDEFTMDLQWPMTPFQAFAVTLSSFDSKIACD